MPIVNQEAINNMMRNANNGAENLNQMLTTKSKAMCDQMGTMWNCPEARNFAEELKGKMEMVVNNFSQNMNAFQSNVTTNVNNYNQLNQSNMAVPAVTYTRATIDDSGIKNEFGNGDQGFAKNADPSTVKAIYDSAISEMESEISNIQNSISSSGAFDADESAAVAGMYQKIGKILSDSNRELSESLSRYLTQTQEVYGQTQSTNIGNANQA